MQIFANDNRYSPGSACRDMPHDAFAAYSARWLDRGAGVPADVLPDRQGIAWDHDQYKVILLGELNQHRASHEVPNRPLLVDVGSLVFDSPVAGGLRFKLWARRAGGYYYVDAFIVREPVDMSCHTLTIIRDERNGYRVQRTADGNLVEDRNTFTDLIDENLWCDDCRRQLALDDLIQHGVSKEWEWK